jgi:hypothetical protein
MGVHAEQACSFVISYLICFTIFVRFLLLLCLLKWWSLTERSVHRVPLKKHERDNESNVTQPEDQFLVQNQADVAIALGSHHNAPIALSLVARRLGSSGTRGACPRKW